VGPERHLADSHRQQDTPDDLKKIEKGQSFCEYFGLAKEYGTELLDHAAMTKNIDATLHQNPIKSRWSF
jgi:hypothetical protein